MLHWLLFRVGECSPSQAESQDAKLFLCWPASYSSHVPKKPVSTEHLSQPVVLVADVRQALWSYLLWGTWGHKCLSTSGQRKWTRPRQPTPGIPRDLLTQSQGALGLPPAAGPLLTRVSPQSPLGHAAGALPPHPPSFHLHRKRG